MQQTDTGLGAILVHGLWHGGWVWESVRRELEVDLPETRDNCR
ncbi:MAG TPA: hypothetical protein VIJ23_12425 [Mycobacterium sp.]